MSEHVDAERGIRKLPQKAMECYQKCVQLVYKSAEEATRIFIPKKCDETK